MTDRISSLDVGYITGDLSLFPEAIDTKETLYLASNNAETILKQTLSYNGKMIIVEDASNFPEFGQLRVGPAPGQAGGSELIYYAKKLGDTFVDLKRGFAGSQRGSWAPNSWVTNAVAADHHNAIKDAIINIETNLGTKDDPEETTLNGILKAQEIRFLTPKPLFRAFPIKGPPALNVRFQNFTTGHIARYFWDFGDGGTSLEKNPNHTYLTEGIYTVKLNIITSTGAQGIVTKNGYIEVNSDESIPFFYVDSIASPYSVETATQMTDDGDPTSPKDFLFIDQTDGDIIQRNWIFGDGETYTEEDPDVHTITHTYQEPGDYVVTLLAIFSNQRLKKVELPTTLSVL